MLRPFAFLCVASLWLHSNTPQSLAAPTRPPEKVQNEEEGALLNSVAYILSLPEEEMLQMIPKDSRGIFWTTCPHCRKRSRVALWKWKPEAPGQITCEDCHTTFPNKDYPDDTFIEVATPSGGPSRFYFYIDRKQKPGKRYFLRASADFRARTYIAERALDLGKLYKLTGDEKYAERAAAILREFARVFPRYPYIYDGEWHGKEVAFFPAQSPPPLTSALYKRHQPCRWNFWGYMDLPRELLLTWQNLRHWPKLASDKELVKAFKENIVTPQLECVLRFPEDHKGNMSISAKWPDLILAAQVLERPDITRHVASQLKIFQDKTFLYDGAWWETSPSYAHQISRAGLLRLPSFIESGSHAEAASDAVAMASELTSHFDEVQRSLRETALPNGRLLPVNDTWAKSHVTARQETKPVLWPGLGIAILGGGKGAAQWHSYLNFTSGRSHKHADALSIGLTINDAELFSDIGYTHSRYQPWTQSTHAHNTVVVNGINSQHDIQHTGNRLLHFFADPDRFQLVTAESRTAYPNVTTRYERTLALIGHDADDAFLIDLFHVAGGTQHDYLLHGSADADSTATIEELPLQPYEKTLMAPGARFSPPTTERASIWDKRDNFGYVNTIRHAASPGGTQALNMALHASRETGTRSFLATEAGDNLFLGQAPSVRRTIRGHLKEDEAKLDLYQAPFFSWRRSGNNLQSTFAAVHQPLTSKRRVQHAAKLHSKGNGTLLRIDFGEGETVYFAKGDSPDAALESQTEHGHFSLTGSIGYLRLKNGEVQEARLLGGRHLALGDYSLEGAGRLSGELLPTLPMAEATRPTLTLQGTPPAHAGSLLIVTFPDQTERAYLLGEGTSSHDDQTRVFPVQNTGFTMEKGKIEITSFPQRTIPGSKVTYRLDTIVTDFPNR